MSTHTATTPPEPQAAAPAQTAEQPWFPLAGFDADSAKFPTRAKIGGEGIIVVKTKTGYRGIERACPHMQASMLHAEMAGSDTMVRCPLHMFTFKLSDGKGVNCPGFKIKVYEVKEEGGQYFGRLAN